MNRVEYVIVGHGSGLVRLRKLDVEIGSRTGSAKMFYKFLMYL